MRFEIGQQIWIGDFSPMDPTYVTCPDCGGTGRIRVTFHDDTQVSIDCQNCARGYDPPTGRILVYRNSAKARLATIGGIEIDRGQTRWKVDCVEGFARIIDDESAFNNEAEALAWAETRSIAHEQEQRDRIAQKEKDTRSWAWNASYHRKEIERAKQQIEYHSAKLAVAAIKAKENKAA